MNPFSFIEQFVHIRIGRRLIICLLLCMATLFAYIQVKDFSFIAFDDNEYVTGNPIVKEGLTWKGVNWAFSETHAHNWHPITWLSHMLDCQVFGLKAGWHHLVNLFFHVANTLLLFLILYRMTKTLWQSAFVAGLFALHPLHVESVAWVAERKDVLSTLFWMLTIGAYVHYVERPGYKRYLSVLAFFLVGLMSKPMLVTLPFVLLLLDYWPLKRLQTAKAGARIAATTPQPAHRAKRKQKLQQQPTKSNVSTQSIWPFILLLLKEKIPLFILAVLLCFVTVYAQHRLVKPMELYPLDGRIANALISYVSYIGKMLWPVKLSYFYPYSGVALFSWQVVSAALALMVTTYMTIRAAKRFPYLVVGWLWYLGTLIPVIGLVQVGNQAMADRYTYVPFIGLFIMLAWGTFEAIQRWKNPRVIVSIYAATVLAACFFATWIQVGTWRNSETVYTHAIQVNENNYIAYNSRGVDYFSLGNYNQAIGDFDRAIEIYPQYETAYNGRGAAYCGIGNYNQAIRDFDRAIEIDPQYASAYHNRGNAHGSLGAYNRAIEDFKIASKLGNKVSQDFLRRRGIDW
jgi:tetratricopeptide (TPR) repeat protein